MNKYLVALGFCSCLTVILVMTGYPFFTGIAFTLAFVVGVLFAFNRIREGYLFGWICVSYVALFFVSPQYALYVGDVYDPRFGVTSDDQLRAFSLFTILCFYIFIATYVVFGPKRRPVDISSSVDVLSSPKAYGKLVLLSLVIVSVIVGLLFIDYGVSSFKGLSKSELRQQKGIATLLAVYLIYCTVPLYFFLGVVPAGRRFSVLLLVLLIFFVYIFFVFKIRTFFIAPLLAYLLGLFFWRTSHRKRNNARLSSDHGFAKLPLKPLIVLSIPLGFLAVFVRFFRGYLDSSGAGSAFQNITIDSMVEASLYSGDFGYSSIVLKLMNIFPAEHSFLFGQSYYRLMFTIIPRFVYPDKPWDTQNIIGGLLFPHIPGMSIPPGINGDAYVNFGYIGAVVFIFHGLAFALLDRIRPFFRLVLFSSTFVIAFHFTRGAFTNPILIFCIVALSVKFYLHWLGLRRA